MRVGYDTPADAKSEKKEEASAPPEVNEPPRSSLERKERAPEKNEPDVPPELMASSSSGSYKANPSAESSHLNELSDMDTPPEFLSPSAGNLRDQQDPLAFELGRSDGDGDLNGGSGARDGGDADLDLEMSLMEMASQLADEEEEANRRKSKL